MIGKNDQNKKNLDKEYIFLNEEHPILQHKFDIQTKPGDNITPNVNNETETNFHAPRSNNTPPKIQLKSDENLFASIPKHILVQFIRENNMENIGKYITSQNHSNFQKELSDNKEKVESIVIDSGFNHRFFQSKLKSEEVFSEIKNVSENDSKNLPIKFLEKEVNNESIVNITSVHKDNTQKMTKNYFNLEKKSEINDSKIPKNDDKLSNSSNNQDLNQLEVQSRKSQDKSMKTWQSTVSIKLDHDRYFTEDPLENSNFIDNYASNNNSLRPSKIIDSDNLMTNKSCFAKQNENLHTKLENHQDFDKMPIDSNKVPCFGGKGNEKKTQDKTSVALAFKQMIDELSLKDDTQDYYAKAFGENDVGYDKNGFGPCQVLDLFRYSILSLKSSNNKQFEMNPHLLGNEVKNDSGHNIPDPQDLTYTQILKKNEENRPENQTQYTNLTFNKKVSEEPKKISRNGAIKKPLQKIELKIKGNINQPDNVYHNQEKILLSDLVNRVNKEQNTEYAKNIIENVPKSTKTPDLSETNRGIAKSPQNEIVTKKIKSSDQTPISNQKNRFKPNRAQVKSGLLSSEEKNSEMKDIITVLVKNGSIMMKKLQDVEKKLKDQTCKVEKICNKNPSLINTARDLNEKITESTILPKKNENIEIYINPEKLEKSQQPSIIDLTERRNSQQSRITAKPQNYACFNANDKYSQTEEFYLKSCSDLHSKNETKEKNVLASDNKYKLELLTKFKLKEVKYIEEIQKLSNHLNKVTCELGNHTKKSEDFNANNNGVSKDIENETARKENQKTENKALKIQNRLLNTKILELRRQVNRREEKLIDSEKQLESTQYDLAYLRILETEVADLKKRLSDKTNRLEKKRNSLGDEKTYSAEKKLKYYSSQNERLFVSGNKHRNTITKYEKIIPEFSPKYSFDKEIEVNKRSLRSLTSRISPRKTTCHKSYNPDFSFKRKTSDPKIKNEVKLLTNIEDNKYDFIKKILKQDSWRNTNTISKNFELKTALYRKNYFSVENSSERLDDLETERYRSILDKNQPKSDFEMNMKRNILSGLNTRSNGLDITNKYKFTSRVENLKSKYSNN